MNDYTELVEALRYCAGDGLCDYCPMCKKCLVEPDDMRRETADAIVELQRVIDAMPRWISVKDKLPETRDYYLASTADVDMWVCEFIPSVKQWWTVPGDELHISDIAYWMPLPEPPKEET